MAARRTKPDLYRTDFLQIPSMPPLRWALRCRRLDINSVCRGRARCWRSPDHGQHVADEPDHAESSESFRVSCGHCNQARPIHPPSPTGGTRCLDCVRLHSASRVAQINAGELRRGAAAKVAEEGHRGCSSSSRVMVFTISHFHVIYIGLLLILH